MVIGIQSQLVLPRCSWVHILAQVMYNVWVNGDWYPEPVSVPTISWVHILALVILKCVKKMVGMIFDFCVISNFHN